MKLTRIFRELKLQDNVEFMGEKFLVTTVKLLFPATEVDYSKKEGITCRAVWYETMIFSHKDDGEIEWSEEYCKRYDTKKEAIKGHYKLLKRARNNYKGNRQYWRAKHGRAN